VYKLNSVYPYLESAWFQPLEPIKSNFLVSEFAFTFNLYRYSTGRRRVLDLKPDEVNQRVPFFTGSPKEVQYLESFFK
jgi:hypothetical protein